MLRKHGLPSSKQTDKRIKLVNGSLHQAIVDNQFNNFVEYYVNPFDFSSGKIPDETNISENSIVDNDKGSLSAGNDGLGVELDCETVEMIASDGLNIDDSLAVIKNNHHRDNTNDNNLDVHFNCDDAESNGVFSSETQLNNSFDDKQSVTNSFIAKFVSSHSNEVLDFFTNGNVIFSNGDIKVEMSDIADGYFPDDGCYSKENDNEDMGVVVQCMDITEPLSELRRLLGERFQLDYSTYELWLQDSVQLDPDKNLVSQCLEGSGVVQINVQFKHVDGKPRINIIDVLKPVEEGSDDNDGEGADDDDVEKCSSNNNNIANLDFSSYLNGPGGSSESDVATSSLLNNGDDMNGSNTIVTKWIVDPWFCNEQIKQKIPKDPAEWTSSHIKFWLRWATRKFKLKSVSTAYMENMNGVQLVNLSHSNFAKIFPNDVGDVFWTHLELLRKCKFVAVMQSSTDNTNSSSLSSSTTSTKHTNHSTTNRAKSQHKLSSKIKVSLNSSDKQQSGSRFGNNGQIQLWQFLLELLTDKNYRDWIQWAGDDGEFRLINPELVAQLWGQRKSKANMNYEKLSRALRYYYDGDMIAKVHGKRFVYKFVCDLKTLLGYSASELNQLVLECAGESNNDNVKTEDNDIIVHSANNEVKYDGNIGVNFKKEQSRGSTMPVLDYS